MSNAQATTTTATATNFLSLVSTHKLLGPYITRAVTLYDTHTPQQVKSGVQRVSQDLLRVAAPVAERIGLPPLDECVQRLDSLGCHTLTQLDQHLDHGLETLHAVEARVKQPASDAYVFLLTRTEALVDRLLPAEKEESAAVKSKQEGEHQDQDQDQDHDEDEDALSVRTTSNSLGGLAQTVKERLTQRVQELLQHASEQIVLPQKVNQLVDTACFVADQTRQTLTPVLDGAVYVATNPVAVATVAVDAVDARKKELRERLANAIERVRSAPVAFIVSFVPASLIDSAEKSYVYVRASYVDPAVQTAELEYGKVYAAGNAAVSYVVEYVRPYESRVPVQQVKEVVVNAHAKVVAILGNNASTVQAFAQRFGLHLWIPAAASSTVAAVPVVAAAN